MFSALEVSDSFKYSGIENMTEFEFSQIRCVWLNSRKLKLTPTKFPTASLWGIDGCPTTLRVDGANFKEELLINNKETLIEVPQFKAITLLCESNGSTRSFTIQPVITNVEFHIDISSNTPVIRISYPTPSQRKSLTYELLSQGITIRSKGVLEPRFNIGTVDEDISIPLDWYRGLNPGNGKGVPLKLDISLNENRLYSDSFSFEIPPPPPTFFRPEVVSVNPLVSPSEGSFIDFKLEPLSPMMNTFNGKFLSSSNNEIIQFSIKNGNGRLHLPSSNLDSPPHLSETPESILFKTRLNVSGNLELEHYDVEPLLRPVLECQFREVCCIQITKGLDYQSNEDVIRVDANGIFSGSIELKIKTARNELEIANYIFKIRAGCITYSVKELRQNIPRLEEFLSKNFPTQLSVLMTVKLFENDSVFDDIVVPFVISRADDFLTIIDSPSYLQGNRSEQHWRFNYTENRLLQEKFILDYAGALLKSEKGGAGCLDFVIPSSLNYDTVSSNPEWRIRYEDKIIYDGSIKIEEIHFERKVEEIVLFYSEKAKRFSSFMNIIGEFESRGQENVDVKLSVSSTFSEFKNFGKEMTVPLHEIKSLTFDHIESILNDYSNHFSSKNDISGTVKIEIPSRKQILAEIPVSAINNTNICDVARNWLKNTWNLESKMIEELAECHRGFFTYVLCSYLTPLFHKTHISTIREAGLVRNQNPYNRRNLILQLQRQLKSVSSLPSKFYKLYGEYDSEICNKAQKWMYWYETNLKILDNPKYQKMCEEKKEPNNQNISKPQNVPKNSQVRKGDTPFNPFAANANAVRQRQRRGINPNSGSRSTTYQGQLKKPVVEFNANLSDKQEIPKNQSRHDRLAELRKQSEESISKTNSMIIESGGNEDEEMLRNQSDAYRLAESKGQLKESIGKKASNAQQSDVPTSHKLANKIPISTLKENRKKENEDSNIEKLYKKRDYHRREILSRLNRKRVITDHKNHERRVVKRLKDLCGDEYED